MAAYRRVYDSRHLQADCQEPGSAPAVEYGLPYAFINLCNRECVDEHRVDLGMCVACRRRLHYDTCGGVTVG